MASTFGISDTKVEMSKYIRFQAAGHRMFPDSTKRQQLLMPKVIVGDERFISYNILYLISSHFLSCGVVKEQCYRGPLLVVRGDN